MESRGEGRGTRDERWLPLMELSRFFSPLHYPRRQPLTSPHFSPRLAPPRPSSLVPCPLPYATLRARRRARTGRSFQAIDRSCTHGTPRRQCRGTRSARCWRDHPALYEPRGQPQDRGKARMDFATEVDRLAEAEVVRELKRAFRITESWPRKPGVRATRRKCGHRPARRHPQLPARVPAFLRLDRLSTTATWCTR